MQGSSIILEPPTGSASRRELGAGLQGAGWKQPKGRKGPTSSGVISRGGKVGVREEVIEGPPAPPRPGPRCGGRGRGCGEVGRGGGAEEQEALGRGSTQQDSWTATSLSQLGSSSEPCSARQGVGQA